MRAVVYEEFGRLPEVRVVPDPVPAPRGAVIRVAATGLCRSDWHGWLGHDADVRLPHVPGHELAGTVAAVGERVRGAWLGERVTVPFVCACGGCAACAAGAQQVCRRQTQPGFTHWGSFAEYVMIENADVNLVRIPDDLSFATAASLGCRFATAFRAVVAQGGVRPGEWVAVHGCGGVGLSAIMIAVACGARVVAVDVAPPALAMAGKLGAAVTIDGSTGDVAERITESTRGGAHLSVDALGSPATCAASINCLRWHGRHVQIGLLPTDPELPMARVIARELTVAGSHGMAAHAYPPMLDMINAGALRPDLLVTATIGLDDVPNALAAMGSGSPTGVTIIEPHAGDAPLTGCH
ncbi:MAG TPA: zinc-dependent alcohol dehydrogenase family protein [Actinophytocola sp.]|uniref:zinc-dependent alcohol dehydrogenase family protein n=1 Tax=Actinophytocola sp. TaxID=1872138 RepID=UPI002DDD281E|nr:zinc-dependent alcohol dehydrogenase family protein [Actinophytocola sp.]HEV2784326.1 zinc-dependent alcohol dehydrogenase family protein [Actinophytocola sp.]